MGQSHPRELKRIVRSSKTSNQAEVVLSCSPGLAQQTTAMALTTIDWRSCPAVGARPLSAPWHEAKAGYPFSVGATGYFSLFLVIGQVKARQV